MPKLIISLITIILFTTGCSYKIDDNDIEPEIKEELPEDALLKNVGTYYEVGSSNKMELTETSGEYKFTNIKINEIYENDISSVEVSSTFNKNTPYENKVYLETQYGCSMEVEFISSNKINVFIKNGEKSFKGIFIKK